MFNLINEPWLPVIRKSGKREKITIADFVARYRDDPVQFPDASRPDFNGALMQFLIGLIQTTYSPSSDREWRKKFRDPPSPDELKTVFKRYAHAFNLDGDSPRFMQDFTLSEHDGELNQIDHLLMEMPGEQTIERNADHFLKRDTVRQICVPCSAMALFTLQTNAPSGGRGHRTSVRGGGPLTTIVMGRNLWETSWLNVLDAESFSVYGNAGKVSDSDIFPWMGPTRTGEKKGEDTTSQHVNPAQMFWGMPRRIRLTIERSPEQVDCHLCGCSSARYVTQYLDKSYGINYKGGWHHTLTPYSLSLKNEEPLPKHGTSAGILYRHWLGLIQNAADKNARNEPAVVVHTFREKRQDLLLEDGEIPFRLWAFGYDTDNMKVCGWYEGTMPLIHVDREIKEDYECIVNQIIKTADLISYNLRSSVRKALFSPGAKISGDLSFIDTEFWQNTESSFYQMLNEFKTALQTKEPVETLKLQWLRLLKDEGDRLFDRYSQSNLISVADPKRIAIARRDFNTFSSRYNKKIIELLDLPQPKSPEKSRERRSRGPKENNP